MPRPTFFIVGAPKSGTTALQTYLSGHPEIFMPSIKPPLYHGKELNFFGGDLTRRTDRISMDAYLAFFENAEEFSCIGESSVWYLYSTTAASEIREFNSEAKVIAMLRHPAEMLYSLHSQLVYNGDEDVKDFGKAIAAEYDRLQGRRVPKHTSVREALYYSRVADYHQQLKRYHECFPSQNIHVVLYDDLRDDPATTFKGVLNFLGVDESYQPSLSRVNSNTSSRSDVLRNLVKFPPHPLRFVLSSLLPQKTRAELKNFLLGLNTKQEKRKQLDPELRRQILMRYRSSIEQLADMLDRDLSGWLE